MTNEEKLKANMAAARLIGITIRKQARNDYRIVRCTSMSRKGRRSYAEAAAAAVLEVAG